VLVLGVCTALLCAGGTHAVVSSTLYGGFDADGNIYLTFADGTPIGTPTPPGTLVPAGTYTIDLNNNGLDDLGNPHDFELTGPGVNLEAGQSVELTWTATFQPGSTYVYEDALNPTTQYEVFGTAGSGAGTAAPPVTVPISTSANSSAAKSPSPTGGSPVGTAVANPFRGKLTGELSASGRLTLDFKGKAVGSLSAGRYTISISDRSAKSGFTLQEIRESAITLTSARFVGTKSTSVDLSAGQWFFYASFIGKKSFFIVIS
jgi:hypothetical protein